MQEQILKRNIKILSALLLICLVSLAILSAFSPQTSESQKENVIETQYIENDIPDNLKVVKFNGYETSASTILNFVQNSSIINTDNEGLFAADAQYSAYVKNNTLFFDDGQNKTSVLDGFNPHFLSVSNGYIYAVYNKNYSSKGNIIDCIFKYNIKTGKISIIDKDIGSANKRNISSMFISQDKVFIIVNDKKILFSDLDMLEWNIIVNGKSNLKITDIHNGFLYYTNETESYGLDLKTLKATKGIYSERTHYFNNKKISVRVQDFSVGFYLDDDKIYEGLFINYNMSNNSLCIRKNDSNVYVYNEDGTYFEREYNTPVEIYSFNSTIYVVTSNNDILETF